MDTKKVRLEDTTNYLGDVIRVFKSDFEIHESNSGYYGIGLKDGCAGHGIVFGWDSGWEDSYDKELMKNVYQAWDGYLYWEEDRYLIR